VFGVEDADAETRRHAVLDAAVVRFHENGSRIFDQMALALGHNTRDSEPSRLRV
jgi:hypothetical protein